MAAQIIIDARTRRVRASLDAPGEGTTIIAVDLIGDTWDDYIYFVAEARTAQDARDLTKRNRTVRAATAALFSHLDGVISDIFLVLRSDPMFAAYEPKRPDFCSLKIKILSVHAFLSERRDLVGAPPRLELKLLRDILNHPTVTKSTSDGGTRGTVELDGPDVYGIAIEDLEAGAAEIDAWLNSICKVVPYERFRDTKQLIEEFLRVLGEQPGAIRTF